MSSAQHTEFCQQPSDCANDTACVPTADGPPRCACTVDDDCGQNGKCNVSAGICEKVHCLSGTECGDHGFCAFAYGPHWKGGLCSCLNGWSKPGSTPGNACAVPPRRTCTDDCDCGNFGVYGRCVDGVCVCSGKLGNCKGKSDETAQGVVDTWGIGIGGSNCQTHCDSSSQCGLHGRCDPETKACECTGGWSGLRCHIPPATGACSLDEDCNWIKTGDISQGKCRNGLCECTELWSGPRCQQVDYSGGGSGGGLPLYQKFLILIGFAILMEKYPALAMFAMLLTGNVQGVEVIGLFSARAAFKSLENLLGRIADKVAGRTLEEEGVSAEMGMMGEMMSEFLAKFSSETAALVAKDVFSIIGSVLDPVFAVIDPIMILGIVLDTFDTAGYNQQLNNDVLQLFRQQMYRSMGTSQESLSLQQGLPFELRATQTKAFSAFLSSDDGKEKARNLIVEYLKALKFNSDGVLIVQYGVAQFEHQGNMVEAFSWWLAGHSEKAFNFIYSWKLPAVVLLAAGLGLLVWVNVVMFSKYRNQARPSARDVSFWAGVAVTVVAACALAVASLISVPAGGGGSGGGFRRSGYVKGHAPTSLDVANALRYAQDKLQKMYCATNPTGFTYAPDDSPGYICPEPLQCESGVCYFTAEGCGAASHLPYWDCERHDDRNVCKCDYDSNTGDCLDPKCEEGAPKGCVPGDTKDAYGCFQDSDCPGHFPKCDTETAHSKKVRVGGRMTFQCVNRKNQPLLATLPEKDRYFLQWDEDKGKCMLDNWAFRQWCEMPWTRKGYSVKNPNVPPLYYNYGKDNRCYTTKQYCDAFEVSYGKSKDVFVFSDCNTTGQELDLDSDCCIDMNQSVAEFFFGKTIYRSLGKRMLGCDGCQTADVPPAEERLRASMPKPATTRQYLGADVAKMSPKPIPTQRQLVPGVDMHLFEWKGGGERGVFIGANPDQLRAKFPDRITRDQDGHEYFSMDDPHLDRDVARLHFAYSRSEPLLSMIWQNHSAQVKK